MSNLIPFLITGLVTGSAYGLAALGLALTYETSGVMNFGQGATAAAAAYAFYELHVVNHWPWPVAIVVCVVGLGAGMGFLLEVLARRMAPRATSFQIVGTVGIILLIEGATYQWKGQAYKPFPAFLPGGQFSVGSVYVTYAQVGIFASGLILTAAIYALLRRTRLGFATRAVVDDPDLLSLTGMNPSTVRRVAWMVGTVMACLAGVILAPSLSLDSVLLIMLVVQAFGAAALGYFRSLPRAYAGGLAIGIVSSIATKYVTGSSAWIAGIPSSVPFLVLFLAIVFIRRDKFVVRRPVVSDREDRWEPPPRMRVASSAILLVVLILVPQWSGHRLALYLVGMCYVLLFISLGLLAKTARLVSLCHLAYAALGLTAFTHLSNGMHLPWLVAALLAGLLTVPAGAIIAIPAIRVSGVFLALATFGFGVVVQQVFYSSSFMFGSSSQATLVSRPSLLATDERYYYLVLTLCVVVGVGVALLHATRLGRLLRGFSETPLGLASLGLSTNVTLVTVFCLSAFLAGIFGAVFGGALQIANGSSFDSFTSLILLVVLAITPGGLPWCAVFAAFAYIVAPSYLGSVVSTYVFTALFGAVAIYQAMFGQPVLPGWLRTWVDQLGRPKAATNQVRAQITKLPRRDTSASVGPVVVPASPRLKIGIEVDHLTVRYNGVTAVDDLSFRCPMRSITGVIGPNGAGKTTTFNACSGLVVATSGHVRLDGRDISRLSPAARARAGIGRTFQRMQLVESETVSNNVALGYEAPLVGRGVLSQVIGRPSARARGVQRAAEALELCGIAELGNEPVNTLVTGQRRLVELARCLAGPFDFLLLDEPSSGLDSEATEQFGDMLRSVVSEREVGVALVEHDMSLVTRVSAYVYVLNFGQLVFEGTPAEVMRSDVVRSAYLGSAAADAEDSSAARSV